MTHTVIDPATGALAFEAMCTALRRLPARSVVLIHACCHNPTGVDLTRAQWDALIPLLADGVLAGSRAVPSAVLVAVTDEDSRPQSDLVAASLRASGVPCEVAASAQKFGKQIRYAERRGIPFVWFVQDDGTHQVKDIRTGDQSDADPATWTPPHEDLRPQVRTKEQPQ